MIHYHGTPLTPDDAAARILRGRHAMVSFARPDQIAIVAEVCQSFCLDNGAFSAWRGGRALDPIAVADWCAQWLAHPSCDWCVIPDAIDGTAEDNDQLITRWPLPSAVSVPVWHLHEPTARLAALAAAFHRVALGSSGDYATIGTPRWWTRMTEAMSAICDDAGRPRCKLHGLRMLDPRIVEAFPFSSADSTNVARNIGIDSRWNGAYQPPTKAARGIILAERIEMAQAPARWDGIGQPEFDLEDDDAVA